jgi:very-short-patch-repair endonuclease
MRPLLQAEVERHGETDKRNNWALCASLATSQDGMVARRQLIREEIPRDTIKRWLRCGLLYPRHQGVYGVGHAALAPRGPQRAALLACGDGAILSHASAAHIWGLLEMEPTPVDITVMGRQCRSRSGIRVHQVSDISEQDVRLRYDLPLTSPARTLIDFGATATRDGLERLVAEARVKGLLRPGELEAAVSRAGRRRGTGRIRALLQAEGEPGITRSEGERILRGLIRQARLAQPRSNVRVAGYEVDFLWEEEKVVVEFDGYRFHGHRRAFEHDRRKDVDLANAGYQVLRFTWRQLTEEPLVVIAAIARALGRRSPMAA